MAGFDVTLNPAVAFSLAAPPREPPCDRRKAGASIVRRSDFRRSSRQRGWRLD
jgi:hypothetical protein